MTVQQVMNDIDNYEKLLAKWDTTGCESVESIAETIRSKLDWSDLIDIKELITDRITVLKNLEIKEKK